jgi:hypothetical protein
VAISGGTAGFKLFRRFTMAYNANIPQPTDIPANSQAQLLANFQEINTLIAVNHVPFNVGDQGKHNFMTCPVQAGDPVILPANELAIYSKLVAGIEQIFYRNSAGVTQLTPLPATIVDAAVNPAYALIGGLKLRWGSGTTNLVDGTGKTYATQDINAGVPAAILFTAPPLVIVSRQVRPGDHNDHANRAVYVSLVNLAGIVCTVNVVSYQTDHGNPAAAIGYSYNYFAIGI